MNKKVLKNMKNYLLQNPFSLYNNHEIMESIDFTEKFFATRILCIGKWPTFQVLLESPSPLFFAKEHAHGFKLHGFLNLLKKSKLTFPNTTFQKAQKGAQI